MTSLVKVTKKGQATIPKALREKFGIKDQVVFSAADKGILIKPAPTPAGDYGSLKKLFGGRTAKEILTEARVEDVRRETRPLEHRRK